MPNESLALPELLAGLSDAADYDAVLAAIMATEHGRRFLTEFASRNRNADTAMVVGAIARVEAAIRGETAPQPAARAGTGELIEIAAAIDRIAAAIAAGAPRASDTAAAVERIQDIAFMLHERPLEATLHDSFDAAVRELAAAVARPDSAADATDLLQTLARRVREMIDARMSHQPPAEPFAVPPDGGEALAQAVAAFAASLPTLAEVPDAASEAASEAVAAPSDGEQISEPKSAEPLHVEAAAPAAEPAPANETAMPIEVAETPAAEVNVAEAAAPPQQAEPEILDSASILSQAFSDDHFAGAPVTADSPVSEVQPTEQAASDEPPRQKPPSQPPSQPPSEAPLSAQDIAVEPVADPEEDPADLFESEPVPPATPPVEAAAPAAAEPPHVVPPPPVRAIPRPPLSDPLAAVRELSDEELIALFS
jgi:hypothetical protein